MRVPGLVMRLRFPVIATVAVYLFMRGHDLPGGGFVAGLTMSVTFILQYMAGGTRWVEARLTILPVRWIAVGLLLAAATGIGRSEEHTSELQSLMRISYAVFCLKKKKKQK